MRRTPRRLILAAASALATLTLLDLGLRLAAPALPQRLANYLFTRYHSAAGGMYFREPTTAMNFMWPGLRIVNYWNGLRWRHATDSRGFRNPDGIAPAVLLLGDSMVYGHGVEEPATVAAVLRREHAIGAYDMARQGSCLYDDYVFLRLWLERLRPRQVVLFVFVNDWRDLEVYRSAAELRDPPELARFDYGRLAADLERRGRRPPSAVSLWLGGLPSLRALRATGLLLGRLAGRTASSTATAPALGDADEDYVAPIEDPARREPLVAYQRRLIGDLATRCRAANADLRLVILACGSAEERIRAGEARLAATIAAVGDELSLPVLDTRDGFAACDDCYLPRDGHLTATGHRRLAALLAPWLRVESVARETATVRSTMAP